MSSSEICKVVTPCSVQCIERVTVYADLFGSPLSSLVCSDVGELRDGRGAARHHPRRGGLPAEAGAH